MKCSKASLQVLNDLAIICGAWLTLIAAFLVLRRAGYGTGIAIATMGEDQNWVALLQHDTAHEIANNFWKIDGRNPLSPWFYIIARPFMSLFTNGIALLQYVVGLLLALATYALLRLIGGRGGRWFALSASTIVAVNQANAYFDHIIWNFQVALCCTIISIALYVLFLRTERRWILAYGGSLCFWCISFYTYTLQSGALAAIAVYQSIYIAAIVRKAKSAANIPVGRVLKEHAIIVFDLVPYLIVLVVFLLTWITATPTSGGFSYVFSFKRLLASLQAGVFHQDISLMFQVTKLSPFAAQYAALSILVALALTFLIALSAPSSRETRVTRYLLIMAVTVSIGLPTILVESGGADWPPGSRWRMIYQMTTPVLMLSFAGAVLTLVRLRFSHLILGIVSWVLLSASFTFSLAYNERQVSLTKSEALVREAMHEVIHERILEGNTGPLLFILEIDDSFQWLASETLRSVYMKTWFPGTNVEYRMLPSPRYVPSNPTRLEFNERGIEATGNDTGIPYDRVVLLHAFDKSVIRRFSVSRQEVLAHNGEWRLTGEVVDLR